MNQITPSNPVAPGQLSYEQVVAAMPANLKRSVTQNLVDTLNSLAVDPLVADNIRENYVSYTSVLKDGKYKTEDYLAAVMYVSFKLMGDSNKDAWCKTFPQRHAVLVGKGADEKTISAHVAAYSRGQLVNKVLEQSMVPVWVLNQDLKQKAINHLAHLMVSAASEKVQSDSAIGLINALKEPDVVKGKIELEVKDSSGMGELKNLLGDLARQQVESLEKGVPIRKITDSVIIDNGAQPHNGTGQAKP